VVSFFSSTGFGADGGGVVCLFAGFAGAESVSLELESDESDEVSEELEDDELTGDFVG